MGSFSEPFRSPAKALREGGACQAADKVGAVQQGQSAVSPHWPRQLRAGAQVMSSFSESPSMGGDRVPVSLALIRNLKRASFPFTVSGSAAFPSEHSALRPGRSHLVGTVS